MSCNRKSEINIVEDKSLEVLEIKNKDHEIPIIKDKRIDLLDKCSQDNGIPLEKESTLEENKRISKIRCKQCQKSEKHLQCDLIDKKFKDNQASTILQCEECKYTSTKNKTLSQHVRIVHKNLKRKQCSFVAALPLYLNGHIKFIHSDGADPLLVKNCDHCEFQTLKTQVMRIHVKSKHDKQTKFYCSKCEYKYYFSQNGLHHIKSHKNSDDAKVRPMPLLEKSIVEVPKSKKCPYCEFMTNSAPSLSFHKRTQHAINTWYNCDKCDKTSFSKERILRHIHLYHKDIEAHVKRIGCFECQSNTGHIQCEVSPKRKKPDSPSKKLDCKEIGFAYTTTKLHYLIIHQQLSHSSEAIPKESILKCDLCEFENNRKMVMGRHIKSKHDKLVKFSCSVCAKKSFFKQSVVRHIEFHHKQRQATVLVIGCPQCKDEILHNTCDSVMDARENHIDPIKTRKSRTS